MGQLNGPRWGRAVPLVYRHPHDVGGDLGRGARVHGCRCWTRFAMSLGGIPPTCTSGIDRGPKARGRSSVEALGPHQPQRSPPVTPERPLLSPPDPWTGQLHQRPARGGVLAPPRGVVRGSRGTRRGSARRVESRRATRRGPRWASPVPAPPWPCALRASCASMREREWGSLSISVSELIESPHTRALP
jgi:hypothetical protein